MIIEQVGTISETTSETGSELDRLTADGWAALERAMLSGQEAAAGAAAASSEGRFLDLHAVPLIELEQVRGAFSCLDSKYPISWKQQVRQLRAKITQFDEELRGRGEPGLQVLTLCSLNGMRSRHSLAANLGYTLASVQAGRVLVIDAKWKKPELERALGLQGAPGLCEATRVRREEIAGILRRIQGTQLYLMSSGQAASFELEAVDLQGLRRLLAGLRKQFAWIIIDGPGFDSPADAMAMTQVADGTLLVVERERDHFQDVSEALRQTKGRYVLGAALL